MGIFLRQSYNVKPLRWGSAQDIEYAIKVNAEKVYDVDPDSIALAMPLFWGLPCLDYSGKRNDGVNHGAYYKDGELEFDTDEYIDCGDDGSLNLITGTVEIHFKPTVAFSGGSIPATNLMIGGPKDFYFSGSSSRLFYFLPDDSTYAGSNSVSWGTNWYHVAVTSDGTILKMYIDDVLQTTAGDATGQNLFAFTSAIRFGYLNSSINSVRIYNAALSANQIALFHALPYGLYQPVIRPIYSFPQPAISTVNEKLALIEYGDIFQPGIPISIDGLDQADNQQLLWGYPGILWEAAGGAIMNQFQGTNLGSDLFNGTLL